MILSSGRDLDELNAFKNWLSCLRGDELIRAMEFQFLADDPKGSGNISHEYDLLQQIVHLQSPPPTPIHPRALLFRPATSVGATDGRNDFERIKKNRRERPRLFQFLERQSSGVPSFDNNGRRGGTGNRRRQQIVAAKRFDVIARKFITPCGEVLSIGCTKEQREADHAILFGTRIKYGSAFDAKHCVFCKTINPTSDATFAMKLLRMLQVASRGRFATIPFSPTTTNAKTSGGKKGSSADMFFAPWFDPTSQWFSLPMYLASRFEIALWTTFQRDQSVVLSVTLLEDAMEKLAKETICIAILQALRQVLVTDILPADAALSQTRDTMTWIFLLTPYWHHRAPLESSRRHLLQSITTIPLVDLESTTDKLRLLIQGYIEEYLVEEFQKALIDDLGTGPIDGETNERIAKKKRSRKKKRKKQDLMPVPVEESTVVEGDNNDQSVESDEQSDELFLSVFAGIEDGMVCPSSLPASLMEYNRNLMVSVPVNTDIGEDTFEQLGPSEIHESEFHDTPRILKSPEEQVIQPISSRVKDSSRGVKPEIIDKPEALEPTLVEYPAISGGVAMMNDPLCTDDLSGAPPSKGYISSFHDIFDGLGSATRYQSRERSLFSELFFRKVGNDDAQNEQLVASSTGASIASSSGLEDDSEDDEATGVLFVRDINDSRPQSISISLPGDSIRPTVEVEANHVNMPIDQLLVSDSPNVIVASPPSLGVSAIDTCEVESRGERSASESPVLSPNIPEPKTPPPKLTPILVSLEDIKNLRKGSTSAEVPEFRPTFRKVLASSNLIAGSLPSSPVQTPSKSLPPSWSREDLRAPSLSEEHHGRKIAQMFTRQADSMISYRNVAANTLQKPPPLSTETILRTAEEASMVQPGIFAPDLERSGDRRGMDKESCAQSETALEGHDQAWRDPTRLHGSDVSDIIMTTKDGSATVLSHISPHEPEEITNLREERNSFRDMCLTLGAEIAMLKNILAAERGSNMSSFVDYSEAFPKQADHNSTAFFHGIPTGLTSSRTVGTMSVAGFHRGDHESVTVPSEDGSGPHDNPTNSRATLTRRLSGTITGSDASIDHSISLNALSGPLHRDPIGSIPSNGLNSRLTKDIINFLNATNAQLRKQANRRRLATERLSRLITALWPRAQLKIYGSHASGNCLPSSDLDFVICLPAVHKSAPAVAPGVLEGRNAINESSQKLLARNLKGESWIDINTIKIIERTIIPVIKLSTKDSRARSLQLDISFDGPGHHGLEAIDMVKSIMQELPMMRPIMLVLKQFLLDRGLLTSYTGGLSSYGLFLMVARYLQEQPSSWGDCGSLLMGFLDFYGNSFDPRVTGISVKGRQYFSRMNHATAVPVYSTKQPTRNTNHRQHTMPSPIPSNESNPDFTQRHSFNDQGLSPKNSGVQGSGMRPPRFQPISSSSPRRFIPQFSQYTEQGHHIPNDQSGRPYTFDPLFLEDPISNGNNVGRNAFRIFQVLRAFSDAHRALVASLEWDIYSEGDHDEGADYPLLKCLLQSEDVFHELEDNR